MLNQYLKNVREQNPLIHNLTNYVTVNDVANVLLASGASPIMADDIKEVEEITTISNGLNINIGTLNTRTCESMIAAGKKANELNIPVELDPVGVGASTLRTDFVQQLLQEIKFTTIKGNFSEIKIMAEGVGVIHGVDAVHSDDDLTSLMALSQKFSQETGAVIIMTGATDIVSDANHSATITNGLAMMSQITGTGCMLSSLITAYVAANPADVFDATIAAVGLMGLAGENAKVKCQLHNAGTSSFRMYLIDEINLIKDLDAGVKYEIHKK